jgi:hypothetical protein
LDDPDGQSVGRVRTWLLDAELALEGFVLTWSGRDVRRLGAIT